MPLLLLALIGCTAVQDLVADLTGDAPPPPVTAPVVAPPPAPAVDPLTAARAALRTDRAADALAEAEKLVAADPTSDGAWELLEISALRAGAGASLLDRLATDQAIGGRVDRHMGLRARLALAAGRPADALSAGLALQPVAPGDSAAYVYRAIAAGAPAPANLPEAVAALQAAKADGTPLPPEIDGLSGGEFAVVRAEVLGGPVGPGRLDAVATAPLAVRVAALAERGAWEPARATAEEAIAVARALGEIGDVSGASRVLADAVGAGASGGQLDALVAAIGELRAGAVKAEAGEATLAAAALAHASIALRAGQPLVAREAASAVTADPEGLWLGALASAMLGDAAALKATAAEATGPRAEAIQALAAALRGRNPTLPSAGLQGDEAALQALIGAGWLADPGPAVSRARAAARSPDLVVWALLAGDRAVHSAEGVDYPPVRAEMAVRGWLAGGAGGSLPDETHPNAMAWAGALTGAPSSGTGVGEVGRYRTALAAGDGRTAADALVHAAAIVPGWRTGPLAPLLALDGPVAEDFDSDLGKLPSLSDPSGVATLLHAMGHSAESRQGLWASGVPALPGSVTPEARTRLFDAAAHARAATLAWAMGAAPWPEAVVAELDGAAKAADLPAGTPPTLEQVREGIGKTGVISLLDRADGVHVLYLTADRASVAVAPLRVKSDVAAYEAGLKAGRLDLAVGDRVRSEVVDAGMGVLTGIGHYVIVGGSGSAMVPIAALPEQMDGLRYLNAIRHTTHLPDFDALVTPFKIRAEYGVTALALCANEAEAEIVRRHWPDVQARVGPAATVAAWKELAPQARYIHIGGFATAPGGGFLLPSGETLELADLGSVDLGAMSAVIVGPADAEVGIARARVLRAAGVNDILATVWSPNPQFLDTLIGTYWDGVNRRRPSSRAFAEARSQAQKLGGEAFEKPTGFGDFLVVSSQ